MLLRKAARCVRHPSLVRFEIERRSRLREVSKFDFRPYMSAPISNNTYISLTSYGARLNAVHMAIRSLLMQSDTMTQSEGTKKTGAPARDRGSGLRQ